MIKILTIVGARPQFIKSAAVSREFAKSPLIKEVILHTGQHFDQNMSQIFFDEMEIPQPDYNLNIHGLSHGAMTGQMLEGIEKVCLQEKPDYCLVYGDTNSTIAGALAAKKLLIPVVHVEAGLRSFNMRMPEEINRILTDRISDILFCPTKAAIQNLKNEGLTGERAKIVQNGDVMQDAALYYAKFSEARSGIVSRLDLNRSDFALCTIHRQENTDDPERLNSIISALNKLSQTCRVVVPLHPRTRKILQTTGSRIDFDTIDPVGYFDMIELLKNCALVITDSGGLQKEAYFFRKFCITLREETEWVELVEGGFNKLVGSNETAILEAFNELHGKQLSTDEELYGGGNASAIIRETLLEKLSG